MREKLQGWFDSSIFSFMKDKHTGKFDELEHLSVEAAALRQRFEQAAQSGELTEEKRLQLEDEFAALRGKYICPKKISRERKSEFRRLGKVRKFGNRKKWDRKISHIRKSVFRWLGKLTKIRISDSVTPGSDTGTSG
jgi:hypothetical protein